MSHRNLLLDRALAVVVAAATFVPMCAHAAPVQDQVPQSTPSQTVANPQPDAPASAKPSSLAEPDSATQSSSSATNSPSQASQPPATGTALAPYEKQDGITGSKPAGAAIAPGKQHRSRTLAIRVGLIVGAVIAVGVVAGASMASPARAN